MKKMNCFLFQNFQIEVGAALLIFFGARMNKVDNLVLIKWSYNCPPNDVNIRV